MIRVLASTPRRTGFARPSRHAFTLIELITVITIILILAGLILNIAGNAQYKAAMARANSEIKQMETAITSYQTDNGTVPRDTAGTGTTDTLNAQQSTDPTTTAYINASSFLFKVLSGNTQLFASGSPYYTATQGKPYVTFAPNQLMTPDNSASNAPLDTSTYLVDPFGFSYGYSTANLYAQEQNNAAAGSASVAAAGYNPTFDLWSTGGYTTAPGGNSTGGKSYPAPPASYTGNTSTQSSQQGFDATLWAKNW